MHPILNLIRAHKGVDYAAPIGTPVHAAGDGHVSFVGAKGGYGNRGRDRPLARASSRSTGICRASRRACMSAAVSRQGRAHRLCRHDGACHRAASALRVPGERRIQESRRVVHLPDALPIDARVAAADFKVQVRAAVCQPRCAARHYAGGALMDETCHGSVTQAGDPARRAAARS